MTQGKIYIQNVLPLCADRVGISLRAACIRDYQATIWELSNPLQIHVLPDGSSVALYGVAFPRGFEIDSISVA